MRIPWRAPQFHFDSGKNVVQLNEEKKSEIFFGIRLEWTKKEVWLHYYISLHFARSNMCVYMEIAEPNRHLIECRLNKTKKRMKRKNLTNIQMGFFNIRGIIIIAYHICVFNRYFSPAHVSMSYKTRINSIPSITISNHFFSRSGRLSVAFSPCIHLRFVENVYVKSSISSRRFHLRCKKKSTAYTHAFIQ